MYFVFFATFFFSLIFWDTPYLFPFKMLAVTLHELFHSLAAMLFSAERVYLDVQAHENGVTSIHGSIPFAGILIIASSGYLGTVLMSSYFLGSCWKRDLWKMHYLLFSFILLVSSVIVTGTGSLAFFVMTGFGLFLLLIFVFSRSLAFYSFVALQSFLLFYSFFDLLDFRIIHQQSDVYVLYRYFREEGWYRGNYVPFHLLVAGIWIAAMLYFFYTFTVKTILEEIRLSSSHTDTQIPGQEENLPS